MSYRFKLFVDELGTTDPNDVNSGIYVLSGCAVDIFSRDWIKTRADQIKFKYWGRTDIVFHSRELGRRTGSFDIFSGNDELYQNFLQDIYTLLIDGQYTLFAVVCDKSIARERGWNTNKIVKMTARKLIYHYLSWLFGMQKGSGKIVIESATAEKDRYYLNEFSYFLSPGCLEFSVDYKQVRSLLTSISFVTKQNADIEEQLADIFAYAMKCEYERTMGKRTFKVGTYEDKLIRILNKKLFAKPRMARERKMKFYETIKPFCILPRV